LRKLAGAMSRRNRGHFRLLPLVDEAIERMKDAGQYVKRVGGD
jgi:hypothetical protein